VPTSELVYTLRHFSHTR